MHASRFLCLMALALCAGACTKHDPDNAPAAITPSAQSFDVARAAADFEAQSADPGSIEGLILFHGTPPERQLINTAAEGGCGLDPNEPALTEAWVVDHGRMANVFVWLADPPREQDAGGVPSEALLLRQRGCVYRPHALGLRVGQTLRVTNEDRTRHNVHSLPRRGENPAINMTQAEGAAAIELPLNAPEVAFPVVCDLHPWMKAWVGVFEHRFFAVTGADGRFSWSGLPPGDYVVNVWHEALGKTTGHAVVTKSSGARVCITLHRKT